jgi:hypothetical protein
VRCNLVVFLSSFNREVLSSVGVSSQRDGGLRIECKV